MCQCNGIYTHSEVHDGLGRPGKNNVCVLDFDCMCFPRSSPTTHSFRRSVTIRHPPSPVLLLVGVGHGDTWEKSITLNPVPPRVSVPGPGRPVDPTGDRPGPGFSKKVATFLGMLYRSTCANFKNVEKLSGKKRVCLLKRIKQKLVGEEEKRCQCYERRRVKA